MLVDFGGGCGLRVLVFRSGIVITLLLRQIEPHTDCHRQRFAAEQLVLSWRCPSLAVACVYAWVLGLRLLLRAPQQQTLRL